MGTKKMIEILVALLLVAGSWIGSDLNTKHQLSKLPPKVTHETHITKVYQDVEQKQMMISETSSASVSLAIMTSKSNISISIPENRIVKTNYEYRFSSITNTKNSNTTSKTN
jgi:hypothetical protein